MQEGIALDFNGTFFSHPQAADGYTLAHPDPGIRRFWVEHGIAARRIAADMGRAQGSPCINNTWIPDGEKDLPADRWAPRQRLVESLDAMYAEELPAELTRDAIESKLFGIGSRSPMVGSLEFYLSYAVSRKKILTLDMGHFHPTEEFRQDPSSSPSSTRFSSTSAAASAGIATTVTLSIRCAPSPRRPCAAMSSTGCTLAWTISMPVSTGSRHGSSARALLKAPPSPSSSPPQLLKEMELNGDRTGRLALMEELKMLPFAAVWNRYCEMQGVPSGPPGSTRSAPTSAYPLRALR